jgi:hypothetical protein
VRRCAGALVVSAPVSLRREQDVPVKHALLAGAWRGDKQPRLFLVRLALGYEFSQNSFTDVRLDKASAAIGKTYMKPAEG